MIVSAKNIDSLHIERIDVIAHTPGHAATRGQIANREVIRRILLACRSAKAATCHMESYAVPKYFLRLFEENDNQVAAIEVQAHVVVIGDSAVFTPNREVWSLVEAGLRERSKSSGNRRLSPSTGRVARLDPRPLVKKK